MLDAAQTSPHGRPKVEQCDAIELMVDLAMERPTQVGALRVAQIADEHGVLKRFAEITRYSVHTAQASTFTNVVH